MWCVWGVGWIGVGSGWGDVVCGCVVVFGLWD